MYSLPRQDSIFNCCMMPWNICWSSAIIPINSSTLSWAHSAIKSFTSWLASLSIKFWSLTCTLISFSHNWKIRFAMAEHPPLRLFIMGSCSLQNPCATIQISYLGGYIFDFTVFMPPLSCWGSNMLSSPILVWGFRDIDVNPPFRPVAKCIW